MLHVYIFHILKSNNSRSGSPKVKENNEVVGKEVLRLLQVEEDAEDTVKSSFSIIKKPISFNANFIVVQLGTEDPNAV